MVSEQCMCDVTEVVMEPLGGGGEFQMKSGLYFDEHLVNPVNRNILDADRIGFNFISIGSLLPILGLGARRQNSII
jgi:hypothetical protein